MRRAIRLARRGRGTTHPNPRVGAVVWRDGAAVGGGFHVRAGDAHAEVTALRQAGALSQGATLVVTLEPCAHHGRTPPCADAILAAGIERVVLGMKDPNPLVDGRGIERLRAATEAAGRKRDAVALTYRVKRTGDALPPLASDGERRLFSGSDAAIIDDIRALRDLGVTAIDFDFERPEEAAVIAEMRAFRERVLAKV